MTDPTAALIDFHCHLDLYPDFEQVVAETELAQVTTLAVTTTPLAFERNEAVTRHTRHIRAALGLHPQLVHERAHELALFERLLPRTRYVGEIGLDASSGHYASFGEQRRIFQQILGLCAEAGGKILSVHSVRCVSVVLDLVEQELPPERGKVVLHWFTGSASEATRAVSAGCYFSINGKMLKNDKLRTIIKTRIPREKLLTETDGPFVQRENVAIRPRDVGETIAELGNLLQISPAETCTLLLDNLRSLLTH